MRHPPFCDTCGMKDCTNKHPTNCDRCQVGLAPRRYVFSFKDRQLLRTLCEQCDLNDRVAEYKKTGVLTSRLWLDAVLRFTRDEEGETYTFPVNPYAATLHEPVARRIYREMASVNALHDLFEIRRLSEIAAKEKKSRTALAGQITCPKGNIKLLVTSSAGRGLATMTRKKVQLTSIWDATAAISNLQAGIQSIEGTYPQLLELLLDATTGRLKLSKSSKVSIV